MTLRGQKSRPYYLTWNMSRTATVTMLDPTEIDCQWDLLWMTLKGYRSWSQSFDWRYLENGDRYAVGPQEGLFWKQPCAFDWRRQIWPWMTFRAQKSRSRSHNTSGTEQVAQLWQRLRHACSVYGDFKGVGHFEANFYVEGLRFAPISTGR